MTEQHGVEPRGTSARAEHSPWMPAPPASATGEEGQVALLPGYRDFVLIARSDSSEVYRARQDGVDRPVAIKVLLLDDDEAIARFQREISITVTIGRQHPYIVTVIETRITVTGRPCIVMEYYDLGSLQDRLRAQGPLPWEEVLAAGTVVADALSFAHRHGVLHRDIKPQNILVLPTSYVVADFGIARPINAGHTSSVEWFSYHHASPETLDGDPPTVTDDIWSIGSTLFTLLDGRPPFATDDSDGDTALAYMKRVRTGRPRTLSRPDMPPGLAAIIDRCLRRERSERFPNAASLHDALAALAGQVRAWAPPPATGGTTRPGAGPVSVTTRPHGIPVGPTGPMSQAPPTVATPGAPPHMPTGPTGRVPQSPPMAPIRGAPGQLPAAGTSSRAGSVASGTQHTAGATMPGVLPPSAMANLVASAVAESGYATDESTTTGTGAYPYGGQAPGPPARPARRTGRIALVTVMTVLIGAVVGIGVTVAARLVRSEAGGGEEVSASAPPGENPSVSAPAGTAAPTASPNINNPEIAPTVTAVTQDGTSALIEWQDSTQGEAQFIVVRVVGGEGEPVQSLPAGSTQVVIEGLDPDTGPHCFLVIALVGTERGVSSTRCTGD